MLKRVFKPYFLYLSAAFFIPCVIAVFALLALHIAPFGNHTLIVADSKALFVSDLSYFARLVKGEEGLLYSFQSGIGMNQAGRIGIFFVPVNLIVLLFDITDYASMYTWVIVASVSLCGLTMFVYLAKTRIASDESNLIFSTAYALMGFNIAYLFLYSFLFPVMMFPLISLGVRKIVQGEHPWLYIVTLCYSILFSYYFGYMLCIASAVLFLMWYAEDADRRKEQGSRRILTFALSTIAAGLVAAVVWLPSLLSIMGGRLEQNSIFDLTFDDNMGILDIGAKLFAGANSTNQLIDGLPNIFVGALPLFLMIAFFVDDRNSKKRRLCRAIPILFYLLTFYIKAFSMAMQGFSSTNWFNYRYSFVLSFIFLVTAAEQYSSLGGMPRKYLARACVAYIILAVSVFSKQYEFVKGGSLVIALSVLVLSVGVIVWNRRDPVRAPMAQVAALLIILSSMELYANAVLSIGKLQDWEIKEDKYQTSLFYGSIYPDSLQRSDSDLYRMANENSTSLRCDNDPLLFGYNGTSYFGSQERNFVFAGLSKLGQPWYANRTWYAKGLPATYDSLLGLRYVVSNRDLVAEKGYDRVVGRDGGEYAYKNPYALPFGILAPEGYDSQYALVENPFANLNALWTGLSGQGEPVFSEENDVSFTYHNGIGGAVMTRAEALTISASLSEQASAAMTSDGESSEVEESGTGNSDSELVSQYWVDCTFVAKRDGPIYAYSAGLVDEKYGYQLETIQYLGTYHKGDTVTSRVYLLGDLTEDGFNNCCSRYYVAYEDQDVLARYARQLQGESGTLEKVTDSHLMGSVDAAHDGRLFFTIPYDEGWTLTVDGQEVPLEMDAGLFMSAPLSAGRHDYEMTFFPKGMREGMWVSAAGVLTLVALAIVDRRWRREGAKSDASEAMAA